MQRQTDDVRISEIKELLPPIAHLYELPITETASEVIYTTRKDIAALLRGEDDRLLVVIGPVRSMIRSRHRVRAQAFHPAQQPGWRAGGGDACLL
jgi:phospho-2-dehydro-3-deoxyheptonate aldolase